MPSHITLSLYFGASHRAIELDEHVSSRGVQSLSTLYLRIHREMQTQNASVLVARSWGPKISSR